MMLAETCIYVGQTGTQALDGFKGLRIGQRYTGVGQDDGTVLVAAVGAALGAGVTVSEKE
ncbi:MAG: hypothetical protein EOO63_07350 [Hymenobacter sp.]|nr:MAG: hypothetical protein EOO63_07350 [Hymenobacter sp.]